MNYETSSLICPERVFTHFAKDHDFARPYGANTGTILRNTTKPVAGRTARSAAVITESALLLRRALGKSQAP